MSGATHFIEVLKLYTGDLNMIRGEISDLEANLKATKNCGLETIAIFYIKAKNKSNDNRK